MKTTTDDHQGAGSVLGTVLRAPWSARAWIATINVLSGAVFALITLVVLLALGVSTIALAVTAVFAVPTLAGLLAWTRLATNVTRNRLTVFADTRIPPAADPTTELRWHRRLLVLATSASTWRQYGYHVLAGLLGAVSASAVVAFWVSGLVFATLPLHVWLLPADSAARAAGPLITLTCVGWVVLFVSPWVAIGASTVDATLAKAMLAPTRGEELSRRVESLTESRAAVLAAADSERRRIERDLHDGAQQRLVSLAMNLGISRTTLTDLPEDARAAIEQAHEEAKVALTELREFVRGLHPAVLDDLGLDAALSGIAARSPVPVRLLVDLERRLPLPVETVAYFVVSEALTNVAKHAGATRVDISVELVSASGRDQLNIIVSDDGAGGASLDRGTGLRGLANRVESVDGTLRIDSPPGGPTLIYVELPC